MSGRFTRDYDAAIVLAEQEVERLLRTSFFETRALQGLPFEYQATFPLENPRGNVSLFARFDLPRFRLSPFRNLPGGVGEERPGSLGVGLPFSESAIYLDLEDGSREFFDLSGDIELVLDLGYFGAGGTLAVDPDSVDVWLTLRLPNVTEDGLEVLAGFLDRRADELRGEIEDAVRRALAGTGLASVPLPLSAAACPVSASAGESPSQTPSFDALLPVCLDFSVPEPPPDGGRVLQLHAKMAAHRMRTGVADAAVDVSFRERDSMGVALDPDFVLEELVPPALVLALLRLPIEAEVAADASIPEDGREAEVGRRLEERRPELAPRHFAMRPLRILEPITFPAELLPGLTGSVSIVGVGSITGPIDGATRVIRTTLEVKGSTWAFSFTGQLGLDLRFEAANGGVSVRPVVNKETNLTVVPFANSATEAIGEAALVGAVTGALVGAIGGAIAGAFLTEGFGVVQFAIGGAAVGAFVGAAIGVALAVAVIGALSIVATLAAPGVLQGRFDENRPSVDPGTVRMVVERVAFTDLILAGRARLEEWASVAYRGATPAGQATWALDLDRDLARDTRAQHPSPREPYEDVADDAADVRLTATALEARNGTVLHDFGVIPMWQALAIAQIDLRAAAFDAPATLDPLSALNGVLTSEQREDAGELDPDKLWAHSTLPVSVVGVRTARGRHALLILWPATTSGLRVAYRRYRQAVPEVRITGWQSSDYRLAHRDAEIMTVPVDLGGFGVRGGFDMGAHGVVEVPVQVGIEHHSNRTTGGLVALLTLVRHPIEVAWTCILRGGTRVALPPGVTEVDVDGSRVTFTVDGPRGTRCAFATRRGEGGSFTLEVAVEQPALGSRPAGERLMDTWPVTFSPGKFRMFGFDKVKKLLDRGTRLIRDRELPVGVKVPGKGPGPGPGPDPSPVDGGRLPGEETLPDPGGERPGHGDPQFSTRPREPGTPPPAPPRPDAPARVRVIEPGWARAGSAADPLGAAVDTWMEMVRAVPGDAFADAAVRGALRRVGEQLVTWRGRAGGFDDPQAPDPGQAPPEPGKGGSGRRKDAAEPRTKQRSA